MGVRTTADEKVDEFKDHLNDAISALSAILIEDVYGSDEFKDEFVDKLNDAFNDLLKIKKMFR